jgi:hypothetical protein
VDAHARLTPAPNPAPKALSWSSPLSSYEPFALKCIDHGRVSTRGIEDADGVSCASTVRVTASAIITAKNATVVR